MIFKSIGTGFARVLGTCRTINSMHHIVAIPFDPKLADMIGKKGSENSITFYNRKVDGGAIAALMPSNIEEKFYAVAESMLISKQILISTADVDKLFGEVLIACSLIERRTLFTDDNDITQYLSEIKIQNKEVIQRPTALDSITSYAPDYGTDGCRVDIDKGFPVRGLGTVVLGIVTSGTVRTHNELCHSSGKKVQVRSIQSQDMDINEAGPGTRVGMVLKNIEPSDIEKGDLLTIQPNTRVRSIKLKIKTSTLAKEEIVYGNYYTVVSNFSYSRAQVVSVSGDTLELKLEKKLALLPGDEALLIREKQPRVFASGKIF